MVNDVLTYVFAGFFALTASWGYLAPPRRGSLWVAAALAACAAGAAHYDHFWPMASFGVLTLWALIMSLDVVDAGWRARCGLVFSVTAIAFLALWPSLDAMSAGKFPCPRWVEDRVAARLVAGLDLRGGLRLAYTVEVEEAIKDKRGHYFDDMRAALTRAYEFHSGTERPTEEAYQKLADKVDVEAPRAELDVVRLRFKNPADVSKVDSRFRDEFRAEMGEPEISGGVVTYHLRQEAASGIRERAVAQAKEIIHRRVDELGLREANVSTRDEDIIVEVPGSDDAQFSQIRDIISQTARLEFKMLDDEADFFKTVQASQAELPEGLTWRSEVAPVGRAEGQKEKRQKQIVYAELTKKADETMSQALTRLRDWAATLPVPTDREIGFEMVRETNPDTLKETESGWRTFFLKSRAEVTGDMVRDAYAQPDQSGGGLGGWSVSLSFTDRGGGLFERITGDNVNRRFAIILDGKVESAPEIRGRIAGGHAQITMGSRDHDVQLRDSKKLELVLRSGALPAPISPNNEQRIGPSLGADSIRLGVQGAVGGGLLVLLFMVLVYSRAGFIADIAVLLNVFIQLAILAGFGASMTLPGIAGLALTIGMSVDANVLINERIREEVRNGKSPRTAIELGYNKAFSAILDGHVTTVISGVIMAQYGTGPIKGFAVTLIVGVIVSLFTGVLVSRVMFDFWARNLGKGAKIDVG